MKLSDSRGMTFIEALVWIAIFTSAMLALVSSLLYFYRTNSYVIREATAIAEAQHGMDIAVRAIRVASYANNGAYPMISIAPQEIAFYASVTKGSTYTQKVRLYTEGNRLYEAVTEPSGDPSVYTGAESISKLSDYVQNLALATSTFLYYDKNGTLISDYTRYDKVRFVTINLIVDASVTALPTQMTLTSSAALRNLVTH